MFQASISEVAVNNKTIRCLFASRKGIPSLVLEKSETLRTEGGSIGIHANGWRVLEQLGVASELRKTADIVTE
jgi:2-polyprenyl-6-methoxyphenol hydroxylase-like FAD-dependent oxidoreductase